MADNSLQKTAKTARSACVGCAGASGNRQNVVCHCRNWHLPADLQFVGELKNAARVGCRDQRLDDAARNRMRLIAPRQQPRYPKGAVDAAPLMAGEIEDDEQIARKKWRLDRARFARVANGLMPFRLERPECLAM